MIYEELCEALDEMGATPDSPVVIRDVDGVLYEVEAVSTVGNGTIELTIDIAQEA